MFQVPTGICVAVSFIQGQAVSSYNLSLAINTKVAFNLTYQPEVQLPVRVVREDGTSAFANGARRTPSPGAAFDSAFLTPLVPSSPRSHRDGRVLGREPPLGHHIGRNLGELERLPQVQLCGRVERGNPTAPVRTPRSCDMPNRNAEMNYMDARGKSMKSWRFLQDGYERHGLLDPASNRAPVSSCQVPFRELQEGAWAQGWQTAYRAHLRSLPSCSGTE